MLFGAALMIRWDRHDGDFLQGKYYSVWSKSLSD